MLSPALCVFLFLLLFLVYLLSSPLGVPGVTISATDLTFHISYDLVPVAAGFTGGLHIGDAGGDAAVYIDLSQPGTALLAGSLDHLILNDIIISLCKDLRLVPPSSLAKTFAKMGFMRVAFSANMFPKPLTFFHHTYPSGIWFEVGELFMWDGFITGSALVSVDLLRGVHVSASLQPIVLMAYHLVISGYDNVKSPAELMLDAVALPTPSFSCAIAGGIDLFDAHVGVKASLDDLGSLCFFLFSHMFSFSFEGLFSSLSESF